MKVYVCARIKNKEGYDLISQTLGTLNYNNIQYLRPQLGNQENRRDVAHYDFQLINQSDELWVFGAFGMDCMFEIGYAVGLGLPVTIFVDLTNESLIKEQWMIYGCPIKIVRLTDILI